MIKTFSEFYTPECIKSIETLILESTGKYVFDYSFSFFEYIQLQNNISKDRLVEEGLIKTYPSDEVIQYAKITLKMDIDAFIQKDGKIIVLKYFVFDDIKLKEIFNLGGYFIGFEDDNCYQFEPKYGTDITNRIGRYLYHITSVPAWEKIKVNGLVPKSSNSDFTYPDRICFSVSDDMNKLKSLAYTIFNNKLSKTIDRIRKEVFNHPQFDTSDMKNEFNKKFELMVKNKVTDYVILRVDKEILPDNIRFYYDENSLSFDGVYTKSNIPPQYIECIEEGSF